MFRFSFHNLITPNQYGFRSGSNTTDCLVDLIEEITKPLDEGELAVTLFLDLSKAFDTVNHLILLTKLSYYGVEKMKINGLNHIFIVGSKECLLMVFFQIHKRLIPLYHKGRF